MQDHDFALEWMHDFEAYQRALNAEVEETGYMGGLMGSMCLVLEEFYNNLRVSPGLLPNETVRVDSRRSAYPR